MVRLRGAKIAVIVALVFTTFVFSSATYAWFSAHAPLDAQDFPAGELRIEAEIEDVVDTDTQRAGFHMKREVVITNSGTLDAVVQVDPEAFNVDVMLRDGTEPTDPGFAQNFHISFFIEQLGYKIDGQGNGFSWLAKENVTDKYYVLLSPGASASFDIMVDADAGDIGPAYMGAEVAITKKFRATQNIEDALLSQFGDDFKNFNKVDNEIL